MLLTDADHAAQTLESWLRGCKLLPAALPAVLEPPLHLAYLGWVERWPPPLVNYKLDRKTLEAPHPHVPREWIDRQRTLWQTEWMALEEKAGCG